MAAELYGVSLDEALQNVVERSFYEDCTIVRNDDGTYDVEDTCSYLEVGWTYEGGLEFYSDPVVEHSRLMGSCETFTATEHIRYHLPDIVAGFESGQWLNADLTYQPVYDESGESGSDDNIAGWVLAATYVTYAA